MVSNTQETSAFICTTFTPTIQVFHLLDSDAETLITALQTLQQCAPKALHTLAECLLQHSASLEQQNPTHATSHALRSLYDVCRILNNS